MATLRETLEYHYEKTDDRSILYYDETGRRRRASMADLRAQYRARFGAPVEVSRDPPAEVPDVTPQKMPPVFRSGSIVARVYSVIRRRKATPIRVEDVVARAGVERQQVWDAVKDLGRRGLIERVGYGKYLAR